MPACGRSVDGVGDLLDDERTLEGRGGVAALANGRREVGDGAAAGPRAVLLGFPAASQSVSVATPPSQISVTDFSDRYLNSSCRTRTLVRTGIYHRSTCYRIKVSVTEISSPLLKNFHIGAALPASGCPPRVFRWRITRATTETTKRITPPTAAPAPHVTNSCAANHRSPLSLARSKSPKAVMTPTQELAAPKTTASPEMAIRLSGLFSIHRGSPIVAASTRIPAASSTSSMSSIS